MEINEYTGGSFRGHRGGSFRGHRGGSFRGQRGGSFRGQRGGSFRGQRGGSFRGQRGGSFRGQRGGSFRGQRGSFKAQHNTNLVFKPPAGMLVVSAPPLKSDKTLIKTLTKHCVTLQLRLGREFALVVLLKNKNKIINTLKKLSFEGKQLNVEDLTEKRPFSDSAVLYGGSDIDAEVLKSHFGASSCVPSPNGNVILKFDAIDKPISIKRSETIDGKHVTLQYHISASQEKNGDEEAEEDDEEMEASSINGDEEEEDDESD